MRNMNIHPLETHFVAWSKTQDDLRAAFIVGSRARYDHPADEWSDLDIILLVKDVDYRYRDTSWLEDIAPVWLSQMSHTVNEEPERLALFEGGWQVDFVFHPVSVAPEFQRMVASGNLPETIYRGTRILYDKDNLLPPLPESTQPPAVQPPSAMELRQTLDSFWFSAVYCAKQLRRGELWLFQNASGEMIWPLLRVIEWQTRAIHGWDYDTWHAGKFIAEWADPFMYSGLQHVFSHLDVNDGWKTMQVRMDLMYAAARQLAETLGYSYPGDLEKHISDCVQGIRNTKRSG
jgi:aminoglycoside 6-adenylyltransferase